MSVREIENEILLVAKNPEHNKQHLVDKFNADRAADPKQFLQDLRDARRDLESRQESDPRVKEMLEGVSWKEEGSSSDPTTYITFRHRDTNGRIDNGEYQIQDNRLPKQFGIITTGAIPVGD